MNLQDVLEKLYQKGIIADKNYSATNLIANNQASWTCYGYLFYKVQLKETYGEYTHLLLTPYKIDKTNIPDIIDNMHNRKKDTDNKHDKIFPNYDTQTSNFHPIDATVNHMMKKTNEKNEDITEIKQLALIKNCGTLSKPHYGVHSNMKEMYTDSFGNEVNIKVKTIKKDNQEEIELHHVFINCYFPKIDSKDNMEKAINELSEFLKKGR